ncbi:MAG: hypothetical protein D4R48_01970, partial [Nitrosomonadales bacterium]
MELHAPNLLTFLPAIGLPQLKQIGLVRLIDDLDNLVIQASVQMTTLADDPAGERLFQTAIEILRHMACPCDPVRLLNLGQIVSADKIQKQIGTAHACLAGHHAQRIDHDAQIFLSGDQPDSGQIFAG